MTMRRCLICPSSLPTCTRMKSGSLRPSTELRLSALACRLPQEDGAALALFPPRSLSISTCLLPTTRPRDTRRRTFTRRSVHPRPAPSGMLVLAVAPHSWTAYRHRGWPCNASSPLAIPACVLLAHTPSRLWAVRPGLCTCRTGDRVRAPNVHACRVLESWQHGLVRQISASSNHTERRSPGYRRVSCTGFIWVPRAVGAWKKCRQSQAPWPARGRCRRRCRTTGWRPRKRKP